MSENADKFWQGKEEKLKKKIEETNKIANTRFFLLTDWRGMQTGSIIRLGDMDKDQLVEFDMLRDIHNFLNGIIYLLKEE